MTTPRPCSIASALGVIGEKYSLLVLREVFFGVRRFNDLARNIGAPRDVLTARLNHLVEAGVLEKPRYSERPTRHEYHLTEAGRELQGVLLLLAGWGDRGAAPGARRGGRDGGGPDRRRRRAGPAAGRRGAAAGPGGRGGGAGAD